ncbi:hypothetical protein AB0F25_14165 [Streptomyces wedmorensis]|uniref:hypothetical protein n=1 Tax=Streptomyces wedmorensis TaxID=43759 RepID=UPI003436C3D1
MNNEETVVRLTGLGKAFAGDTREVRALDGVSFDVPAGRFVTLLTTTLLLEAFSTWIRRTFT